VYVPMNAKKAEDAVNHLTGQNRDVNTNTPAYKDTSVRMEVLGEVGQSPLPPTNHRYATRTPQNGVEVQRKWARPDYVYPGAGLGLLEGASLNNRVDKFGVGADD
jgi:formate dehydrogenase major subunit